MLNRVRDKFTRTTKGLYYFRVSLYEEPFDGVPTTFLSMGTSKTAMSRVVKEAYPNASVIAITLVEMV